MKQGAAVGVNVRIQVDFLCSETGCGLKNFVVQDRLHCKKYSKKKKKKTRVKLPVQQLYLLSAGAKFISEGKSEESNAASCRSQTALLCSLFDS